MNIYFAGLGGVGIGPLVDIALDAGYEVQGSDLSDTPTAKKLRERGVVMHIGNQDGMFLQECHQQKPIDLFVYTAALPPDHAELVLAQQLGIKTAKRYEFLSDIVQRHNLTLVAVSGTHGKTTTTGMLLWVLEQLNIPVSYLIGTTLSFGPAGRFNPESTFFVLECDEFERHLLHFSPELSLITSLDYDHPDTYPTKEDYVETFREFIAQSKQVVMWQTDADYVAVSDPHVQRLQDDEIAVLPLKGEHNRRNGTLVLKALELLDLGDARDNQEALAAFPGTGRRFEKLASNLYTDYGHHPAEIAATLQLAKELSDHVVLVYQPHQNRRQHLLKDEYTDQFELANEVYWLPTYLSREDPNEPILSPNDLIKNLTNRQAVVVSDQGTDLWAAIQKARRDGKLVLAMGAGDIDGWVRRRLASS